MMAEKILHIEPCGCKVVKRAGAGMSADSRHAEFAIEYCPKHGSALDLYEVLKASIGRITHTEKCNVHRFSGMTNLAIITMIGRGYDNHCNCGLQKLIEKRDIAIAKVNGGK